MTYRMWLSGCVGLLALGAAATGAEAAPLGVATGMQQPAADATTVQPVTYRRCSWHRGHRHCYRPHVYYYPRSYQYPRYYYGYSSPRRYYGDYGHYGYGPGIGFNFGFGRHGWGW